MNWDFSNASFHNSSIGPNARTYNFPPQRAELLRQLDELRGAVEGTDDVDLVEMIDDLDDAVASGQEDPPALTGRWERIRGRLEPALAATANVAGIASLIVAVAQH